MKKLMILCVLALAGCSGENIMAVQHEAAKDSAASRDPVVPPPPKPNPDMPAENVCPQDDGEPCIWL